MLYIRNDVQLILHTCVSVYVRMCMSYVYVYLPAVTITTSPENTTVYRGSDVIISCGYLSATAFPVTWIINGTSFTQEDIVNSPLYQLNNPTTPMSFSLTVFSINGNSTFQCIVLSTPTNTTTSTPGTVTVTNGMYVCVCMYVHMYQLLS